MSVYVSNRRDSKRTVLPGRPLFYRLGFLAILLLICGLFFHEDIAAGIARLSAAPSDSVRGEWVGTVDLPRIRDPWIRPYSQKGVIRFTLAPEANFLTKYGGKGELIIQGHPPQPIEVTHLWLPKNQHAFECGLWKIPTIPNDPKDDLSGGFEGTFTPSTLTLTRQTAVGYDLTATLHKGTDEDFARLVRQMNSTPAAPIPPPPPQPDI